MSFVHLHLHSEYSLLDGACRLKELPAYVKSLGQSAVAITDHGVMYGVIDFYKACKKAGVKPIIGCEVYVANRTRFEKVHKLDSSFHLVLLCKNQTGYQNLIKLVSAGFVDGFYNKPRVDLDLLRKHSDGLIALSACLAGEIPRLLCAAQYEKAKQTALTYRDIFGADNYYIEIQNHGIKDQIRILPLLHQLSLDTGIPLVATNDAHYLSRADAKMQNVLVCIQTNTTVGAQGNFEFPTDQFYLKSEEEMTTLFGTYEGAIENTAKIADRCNLEFEFGVTKLPRFVLENGQDNQSYFIQSCYAGLHRYYGDHPDPAVVARLEYELGVVIKMGYVDYYLIVHDFIRYAKSVGIPVGPGRGSGAGSLAAYCIGITGIDPLRYNLLFERFLNPERVSMPDFDIDFCYERRQEVIDYVVRKYGADHVAQIITFGTMAAKAAVRDVGRALGMSYGVVDAIAKAIPQALGMTIERAIKESPPLKKMMDADESVRELIEMARRVEGMPRHASTHAAGVVITRDKASDYVPLAKNDEAIVTQYTMTTLEELGLLKMDFLGLRTLTVIRDCEKEIQKEQPDFTIETIPLDDPAVFAMLSAGSSQGVFQFESGGMKQVLTQLSPESLEDLIAVISLYRPGPMESIPKYVRNRHNPEQVTYLHPLLRPILDVTYGCMVYQEQVMQICRELAGYSYGRADLVRRAMAKKKADVMEKERDGFLAGAEERGVSRSIANQIFDEMSSFASYAFNKSHAAAYALIAYQTAYLKAHHPCAYMAALLTSVIDNTPKVIDYIGECNACGIRVLPPCINKSVLSFTVAGADITFGLLGIKNLGRGAIHNIVHEREAHGDFASLEDFCTRMCGKEVNKRAVESLIKSGAFDHMQYNRFEMILSFETLMDYASGQNKANIDGQLDLFSAAGITGVHKPAFQIKHYDDYPLKERLAMEKEVMGYYLSGHPLDNVQGISPYFKQVTTAMLAQLPQPQQKSLDGKVITLLGAITDKKTVTTRAGDPMAFVTLEDRTGTIEVVFFPQLYEQHSACLQKDNVLLVQGTISIKEEEAPKLLCKQVLLSTLPSGEMPQKALYIKVSSAKDKRLGAIYETLGQAIVGMDSVSLYFADQKKYVLLKDFTVIAHSELQNQLKGIVGEEQIVVKTAKK